MDTSDACFSLPLPQVTEKDESSTRFYTESLGPATRARVCTHLLLLCKLNADVTVLIVGMSAIAPEPAEKLASLSCGRSRLLRPAEVPVVAETVAALATAG